MTDTADRRVAYRTCPLCEATCGLEITLEGDEIVRIRGDRDDVFSAGYICPKGSTLRQLRDDPDRIRTPLIRGEDGQHRPATWDEAFAYVADRLGPVIDTHGRSALAAYVGNPNAHHLSNLTYNRVLLRALGTPNLFSASSVDQLPKQIACGLMYGTSLSITIPDVDRTDLLVIMGANPWASNGSLMTAPDLPGRIKAVRDRGGKVVVIDPRRSETANNADEWLPIVPGTDALLLAAVARTLLAEGLADLGEVADHVEGFAALAPALDRFTPAAVADACGIEASAIERLARELAAAPSAAVYGRIGTCTQLFGTTASWLVDVVNALSGNLDRPGGVMFPKAAAGSANTGGEGGKGKGFRMGRRHSRVRGLPEALGELPVATLAEEIETPGDGQIRALFTIAGNPVLSTPNSARLDAALASLDLMVSVDIYLNETTRHADVIFPAPDALSRSHFDLVFYQFSVRNIANYSPPVLPLPEGDLDEWEILGRLALIASGQPPETDVSVIDDLVAADQVQRAVSREHGPLAGRDADEVLAEISAGGRRGPDRLLDLLLRVGPYDLTLDDLIEAPHGIDLGPLEPRIPEVLRTTTGKVDLAPTPLVADLDRLAEHLAVATSDRGSRPLVLIGRRHLRSNNSWMHNVDVLVRGKPRCDLHVNPADAERCGLVDGGEAKISSAVGAVVAPVTVTDDVRPGVVSLPHGWGHDVEGISMATATAHAGVNSNILADESLVDPISGNAVLNGIPVSLEPA